MEVTFAAEERPPTVLVCADDENRASEVRLLLDQGNYRCLQAPIVLGVTEEPWFSEIDLVVIDGAKNRERDALELCQRLRQQGDEHFLPIIMLADDSDLALRAFASEAGADGHLVRPIDFIDLLAQVKSLLRLKALKDRVVEQSNELRRVNRRLKLAYDQIDQELQLAAKIQQSFLPRVFPEIPTARFAVRMEASGRVGGDFYDVFLLDDHILGFYVADAMGHGVPASLLTIYVKKGIVPKESFERGQRTLTPDEVLRRLNLDLIEQDLSENPFITIAYFLLDVTTSTLTFARAGHPFPLLLSPGRPIEELKTDGLILGIVETTFELSSRALAPGDRLIIYTDGIDAVRYKDARQGTPSFLACLDDHRHLPLDEMLEVVYDQLFPDRRHDDDFTMLGMDFISTRRPTAEI